MRAAEIHPLAERTIQRYAQQLDRLLPGAVVGLYLVGSAALGAYRPRRSDVDFVAVLDGPIDTAVTRRLRTQHLRSGLHTTARSLREMRSPLTGTCNGVFVRHSDLRRPVSTITPVASHIGERFRIGQAGSDISPVAWKVLAECGVAVRGPHPSTLGLDPQPELLTAWNVGNLQRYWRPWAVRAARPPHPGFALRSRWSTAWGVLGAPRLHCTITTGQVVSKEAAGEYALAEFAPHWRPLVNEALAYWREEADGLRLSPGGRARLTAEFVMHVVDSSGGRRDES